jgi:hypothetical protein
MEWFVRAFAKASVAWLAAGVTLGVGMAARPAWAVYRPAHVHMVALGFVAMMIYGVAYHVVPRRGAPRGVPRIGRAARHCRPIAAARRRGLCPTRPRADPGLTRVATGIRCETDGRAATFRNGRTSATDHRGRGG